MSFQLESSEPRARSPLVVFHGRPPFDRQPARLCDRPRPATARPRALHSRRPLLVWLGLSVVGGANRGETLESGPRSDTARAPAASERELRLLVCLCCLLAWTPRVLVWQLCDGTWTRSQPAAASNLNLAFLFRARKKLEPESGSSESCHFNSPWTAPVPAD